MGAAATQAPGEPALQVRPHLAPKFQTNTHAQLETLDELASPTAATQVPEPSGGLLGVAWAPARPASPDKRQTNPDLDIGIENELRWPTDESAPTSLDSSELSTATSSTVLEAPQRLGLCQKGDSADAKGLQRDSVDLVSELQQGGWGCAGAAIDIKFKDAQQAGQARGNEPADESCK